MMKTKTEQLDRIFLWLLLTIGGTAFLVYGLSSLIAPPAVETITVHAPAAPVNSNAPTQQIKYRGRRQP